MPELVPNGPDIPVHLLNRLDSGKVVFFCGAGVSATSGSDLPLFPTLVEHVYQANRVEPNSAEREALDLDEPEADRRRASFDKALGLLEGRLGTEALRGTIVRRLSAPPEGDLDVHRALIDLSRYEGGIRLITTNFDNRFVEAGAPEGAVDAAPKLPVPKAHGWSSLVHLHGRILPADDGTSLVLTAADFGRAYLTERWAARFVTEVFREFTVVFVGYSLTDPVMGYMVDAFAAERGKGTHFAEAYAFADHNGTPDGERRARDAWRAKSVTPVLYDASGGVHHRLSETLVRWAEIRKDPLQTRSEIALRGVGQMPAGPDDPIVERVTWALDDPTSARALAGSAPVVDPNEFGKVRTWLDRFSERRLLDCSAVASSSWGSGDGPSVVRMVDAGYAGQSPETFDQTRTHLARWIAHHLHVPQVLEWVLANGGHMHPGLCRWVRIELAQGEVPIPARLRLLWTVLLDRRPLDRDKFLWASDHYRSAASDHERLSVEEGIVRDLTPRLDVRPGPALDRAFQRAHRGGGLAYSIEDCAHLEVVAGSERVRDDPRAVLQGETVLARHAVSLTMHLEKALSLSATADGDMERSYLLRPSIADHGQNSERGRNRWAHLIDLARDGYLALACVDRARADNLLSRWVLSSQPLFRRLALHVLTEDEKANIRLSRDILVKGRRRGLWDLELHREMLRFLRLAGSRLPRDLRVEVVRAIHAGPKGWRRLTPDQIRWEKALRLCKLAESGARLDRKSRTLAAEAESSPDHREEFLIWFGGAEWLSEDDQPPLGKLYESYRDAMMAFEAEDSDPDALAMFVRQRPVSAVAAVRRLSKRRKVPRPHWSILLRGIADIRDGGELSSKLRRSTGRALRYAPDALFSDASWAVAEFLKFLAEDIDGEEEPEFAAIWTRTWKTVGEPSAGSNDFDDPLTASLNHAAGKLAEAALTRLSKHQTDGSSLPCPVKSYFDDIAHDPNGRLGRVMLATSLLRLHTIDPAWTEQNLIERLKPGSVEARDLWSAYAWSRTVGPNLLAAFKGAFLEVLCGKEGEDLQQRLTGVFMAICLEAPDQLAHADVARVVRNAPERVLLEILLSIRQRMKGSADERGLIWRRRMQPWLEDYWPKLLASNTPATASSILDMLPSTGDAFPEASVWAMPHLRRGSDLGRVALDDVVEQFPDEVFRILDAIVAHSDLEPFQRYQLERALNRIKQVRPTLSGDPAFHRLARLAAE